MKISIFGLGYVGSVTLACLANDGHNIIGVDVNPAKVELINKGESPVIEPGLSSLLSDGVTSGRIQATTDPIKAVLESELSLITVGTPSSANGSPNLSYVFRVCREIGRAVRLKGKFHVVVLRSTVFPGTSEQCKKLLEKESTGLPVHFAFNPEFLREGSAVRDFYEPPYTIIGADDSIADEFVRQMYAKINAPFFTVKPAVAELIKYVANVWHATKIVFSNEVGRIAKACGIDGREIMKIIVQDSKLNISPAYMRPGFAFGGSCLPKDIEALLCYARKKDVPVPFLNSIQVSNNQQIDLAVKEIMRFGICRVAVLGLSFKPGTDDLRESPSVKLIKRLIGEGYPVKIFDRFVHMARLMGTNLDYIHQNIPHFETLMAPKLNEALEDAEIVVITYYDPDFHQVLHINPLKTKIIDLAGIFSKPPEGVEYIGICW